ncbi:hypothetical protein [Hydrogenophaga sp.]|uniref:hypothetical protein n=1 Tax=Hydrogenophaga sp. TaxID=1904254 RepID=UPI0024ABB4B6|nr:hypothetical protein [Betaproteobacteria bacterium]
MTKTLLTLLMAALAPMAQANTEFRNVPVPLQKALHGNALKTAQMDSGVLRLQSTKAEVSELVYATFIFHNICGEQWMNPQQFKNFGLQRVELINANGSQGFAFDARGDVCQEMGKLGKNFRSFIAQYTVKCETGGCPQRP